jgi:molybdenum cofactor synthesis domain-containing protein
VSSLHTLHASLILASDRVARGERQDRTASGVRAELQAAGIVLDEVSVVPDEIDALAGAIRGAAGRVGLVLTSGGTGIGPCDVTPEATRRVIEREIPGLGEAMRAASLATVPTASLSRALAGTCGRALVVNLPGSPDGARQCLATVLPALSHAARLLAGSVADCAEDLRGER